MDDPLARDPLEVIGPLCASLVLGFLGPRELARCSTVSHSWRALALLDGKLWARHLAKLWGDKLYVPNAFRELALVSPHRAYAESLRDGSRALPTALELCTFTWALHIKTFLGLTFSPELLMRRYFNPNHTITAPPDDPLWGESEAQRHFWYFRPGPDGSMVLQVNTYPHLVCVRTADWGWELQNVVVRMTIDSAAGPNPGLPPDHPASRETLTLAEIEARFNGLLHDDDDSDDGDDDDDDDDDDDGDGDV